MIFKNFSDNNGLTVFIDVLISIWKLLPQKLLMTMKTIAFIENINKYYKEGIDGLGFEDFTLVH